MNFTEIRDYKKEDLQKIQDFIKQIYKNDEDLIEYYKYATEKGYYTIVAIENSKIIGMGSIWRNEFHDNATYIGINVLPSFRKKGIGTDIFNIIQSKKDKNNLQCAMVSSNISGISFVEKFGFKLVRRTFEPIYDLSLEINFNEKVTLSNDFRICPLSKLNSQEDAYELINLFKRIYKRNHTFNKVSNLSDEQWRDILHNSLYPQGSFVILKDDEIVAFSLVYNSDEKFTLELGLRGVREEFLILEKDILLTMLSKQFQQAKENGFLYIKDEIDDCDSGAMVMSNFLDINKLISWNTFYKMFS